MSRPKKFCITGLTVSVDTFPIVSSLSDELYERTEPVRNCVFRLEILMRQRQAAGGRRQRSFALYDHYLIAAEYRGVRHVQPVHAAVAESNLRAPRHDARFLAGCELTPSRPLVTRKLRLGCSFCRVEGIVGILIAHSLPIQVSCGGHGTSRSPCPRCERSVSARAPKRVGDLPRSSCPSVGRNPSRHTPSHPRGSRRASSSW